MWGYYDTLANYCNTKGIQKVHGKFILSFNFISQKLSEIHYSLFIMTDIIYILNVYALSVYLYVWVYIFKDYMITFCF